ISIDSASAARHDRFRGLQGAWDLSVKAIRDAGDVGIETQLDATLTDENVEELDDLVELAAGLGAKAVNFFFLVCTGRAMRTSISTENYDSALARIAEKFAAETRLMVRARCAPHIYRVLHQGGFSLPAGTRGCLAGRAYMRISPEGDITPCPYMPLVVGNVREASLGTIWEESPELKKLRGGGLRGRCGICEFASICGGCRARGLAELGDFMEEDSLCSYDPEGEAKVELKGLFSTSLKWEDDAKERIRKVPPFIRGMIVNAAEGMARKRGMGAVTCELLDELKKMRHSRMQ
ncbi:MAG: SPASM domain-containing protein, partial [Nitrospirota bacterium]